MKKYFLIFLAVCMMFLMSTPVFAEKSIADPSPFSDNTATTNLSVEPDVSNISATVPLAVTVVAPIKGGILDVPANYKITNLSYFPIKVDGISVAVDDNWEITNTDDSTIGSGVVPPAGKDGKIYMTVKEQALASGTVELTAPETWGMQAKPAEGESIEHILNLPITGKTSMLRIHEMGSANDIVQITYTISAGEYAAP